MKPMESAPLPFITRMALREHSKPLQSPLSDSPEGSLGSGAALLPPLSKQRPSAGTGYQPDDSPVGSLQEADLHAQRQPQGSGGPSSPPLHRVSSRLGPLEYPGGFGRPSLFVNLPLQLQLQCDACLDNSEKP